MNENDINEPAGGEQPTQESQPAHQQPPPAAQQMPFPQQPRQRRSRIWIPIVIGGGCLLLVLAAVFLVVAVMFIVSAESIGAEVAVIPVDGVITTGTDPGGLFSAGGAGSETVVSRLERARKDGQIRVIVLRIDSPGGSAAASEEIYREIQRVKVEKPVYASMGDVAASGGYYVASACSRIFADSATITGSIGVIFESPNLAGLFKKIGVDMQVVKSGKFKDIGSLNRPMTPEEKQLIRAMINDTFEQFIEAVSQGRRMPKEKVRSLGTGAVYTGRQAKRLGLVDDIGGLRETILAAAGSVGIAGEPKVIKYGRRGGILGLIDERSGPGRLTARDVDLIADRFIERLTSPRDPSEGVR